MSTRVSQPSFCVLYQGHARFATSSPRYRFSSNLRIPPLAHVLSLLVRQTKGQELATTGYSCRPLTNTDLLVLHKYSILSCKVEKFSTSQPLLTLLLEFLESILLFISDLYSLRYRHRNKIKRTKKHNFLALRNWHVVAKIGASASSAVPVIHAAPKCYCYGVCCFKSLCCSFR